MNTNSYPVQTSKENRRLRSKNKKILNYMIANWDLYIFLIPVILYYIVFSYVPMYGIQIAFRDFNPLEGFFGSPWVGLEHLERFFNSVNFWTVLKNTLGISIYSIAVGFPIPILFALLLNQMSREKYKRFIQTVTYAPHFISVTVLVGMLAIFLSPSSGIINQILALFNIKPVFFMAKPEWFKTIYVLSGIWQSAGWSSIIYLAALSGISQELHEAAIVDGANKFQRVWNIDIPGIIPTAVIMLILSLGNVMSVGFEKVFLMQNALNSPSSEVISTYVYKTGLLGGQFSFSTAIGLFNSVINFILLILVNNISKKISDISLW